MHARGWAGIHSCWRSRCCWSARRARTRPRPNTAATTRSSSRGGDNAAHDIQFRLSNDATHDEIIDTVQFTSIPADCDVVVANTWISCPGHGNVQVDLGAGNDYVTFVSQGFDCFNAYELNLGEGANTVNLSSDCGDALTGPATINSGSGPDVLTRGLAGHHVQRRRRGRQRVREPRQRRPPRRRGGRPAVRLCGQRPGAGRGWRRRG